MPLYPVGHWRSRAVLHAPLDWPEVPVSQYLSVTEPLLLNPARPRPLDPSTRPDGQLAVMLPR